MREFITRNRDTNLEQMDITDLYEMAENLSEEIIVSEQKLNRVLEQITERTGLAFMGEDTDTIELV